MKRTFKLAHPKTKVDRLVDAVRSEVRKYLRRERRKALPEGIDFWDFACKCGPTESEAQVTHVNDLGKCIGATAEQDHETVYVEILAKPGHRAKKTGMAPVEDQDPQ
ncbi:MAG: DUF6172 family protein [Planctomycetota bacterium]